MKDAMDLHALEQINCSSGSFMFFAKANMEITQIPRLWARPSVFFQLTTLVFFLKTFNPNRQAPVAKSGSLAAMPVAKDSH